MSQNNAEYVIDTTVLLSLLTFAIRIVYVRMNREAYLRSHKYKPGMMEYNNIVKMTSTPVISITSTLLALTLVRVCFDIHGVLHSGESHKYKFLVFGTIGILLFFSLLAYSVMRVLGISVKLPHGKTIGSGVRR